MDRVEEGFLRERRFGADLAHELRTPIAEMRTKLDLAATWPEERTDELFEAAKEIARHMQRVVDTMLHLANLEGGGGGLRMGAVRLAPLVDEAWAPYQATAEERQLKVDIECPKGTSVHGNSELWKHIFANLFSNAVDYTSLGGTIRLTAEQYGLSLANTVGDSGIDNPQQLFERFWRADGSRSDRHHSGLGLSLVQACAHQMGFHASASVEDDDHGRQLVISILRSAVETDVNSRVVEVEYDSAEGLI